MKKYAIVVLSLCLLFLLTAHADGHNTIKGKVISEKTNSPLPGATVFVKNSMEGTITDEWGNFTLDTDFENGILTVSYVGYETKEVDFSSHTEFLVINLKPDIIRISDVSVTSSKLKPGITISKVDVNVRPVNSSQDVLRIVPGLFIAQHGGGGKSEQIFIRGFDCDHGTDINITVDGLPVNMVSQAHGQGYADLHWLIPELIREVDYGKGPYSTEHGDFATGGHIEFKTPSYLDHNLVKVEGGDFNTLRTTGLFNLLGQESRKNGKDAYIGMEYYLTDGPFESPQNFNRLNLFGKFNQVVDQNNMYTITLSSFNTKWDQSGQLPQSALDAGLITRWGAIDPSEGGSTQRYNISVKSFHQLKNSGIFKNQVYYTRYLFDLYSNFTLYLNDPENGDQIRQKEQRNLYGYRGVYSKKYSLNYNSIIATEVGGGFRFDEIGNSQLLNTRERYSVIDTANFGDIFQSNIDLFGQITWTLNKWTLNVGARYDMFRFQYVDKMQNSYTSNTKTSHLISPKLNLAFNATDNIQLFLKAGKSFHSNDARVATRNDSLPTVPVAYGSDLGFTVKPIPNLILSAAVWYMYLESELVWSGDAGTWEPSGKTNRYGVDVSARWQIVNWIYLDCDINYGKATYIDLPENENYVPLAPRWTSTGGLTFKNQSGWSSSLRYRYMSDRPADETEEVIAPGYSLIDFKINYTLNNWTFGVTIENVLNEEWNDAQFASDYRISPTAEPEYGLTLTPGIPRFIKIGTEFTF